MVRYFKMPFAEAVERLRQVEWHSVLDSYEASKRTGTTEEFPTSELADAVCALRYVVGWSPGQIGERTGLSSTQVGVLQNFAFVTNEVRKLADFQRPEVDRLTKEDVNLICRLPPESQPNAAKNLLSIRRKRAANKARRAVLRGETS